MRSLLAPGSWLLLLPLIKRDGNYLRADHAAAHVNLNLLPRAGVLGGHVGHADVLLQVRRGAAGRDVADFFAADVHVLAVARDAALRDLEADELAAHAL